MHMFPTIFYILLLSSLVLPPFWELLWMRAIRAAFGVLGFLAPKRCANDKNRRTTGQESIQ